MVTEGRLCQAAGVLKGEGAYSLFAILPEQLVALTPGLGLSEARRLLSVIHRIGGLPRVTPAGVRREMFFRVREAFGCERLHKVAQLASAVDPFVKYGFECSDGVVVESVRIPLEKPNRFVACVSSQTGCALGCAFCATGRLGAGRNLEAWEIVDQVRWLGEQLPAGARIHGVVFQGMGEPLANVQNVIQALRVMSEPSLFAIDGRAITVSTAGLVKPLEHLLQAVGRVRVGVSIGHADPEKRQRLMPVQRTNPLEEVLRVAAAHARQTRIATMLSYTLLKGENDSLDDADRLGQLALKYADWAGIAPRISLISYNGLGVEDVFCASDPLQADRFWRHLSSYGMPVVRRYSGGGDVGAACGQLGANRWKVVAGELGGVGM